MDLFIAIDSGGTKTEAILARADGTIVRRVCGKGCNPMDVGVKATQTIVCDITAQLLEAADGPVISLYAGIAGANRTDTGLNELLARRFPIPRIRVEDDMRIVVSATLGHQDGCGLICGTGCSLSLIKGQWPYEQIGGLGYLIDTGGSGYELGRQALMHTYRYLDGRGPYTILAETIPQRTGKDMKAGFADIYAGGRPYIASFAGLVFEGAEQGDAICQQILEKGSDDLAELTWAAEKHFEGEFPIVMSGGIFGYFRHYADMVRRKSTPRAKMIYAKSPPVYGALVEACYQCGITLTDDVWDRFMKQYIDELKKP